MPRRRGSKMPWRLPRQASGDPTCGPGRRRQDRRILLTAQQEGRTMNHASPVFVALKRPRGYEDVQAEFVIEDAICPGVDVRVHEG